MVKRLVAISAMVLVNFVGLLALQPLMAQDSTPLPPTAADIEAAEATWNAAGIEAYFMTIEDANAWQVIRVDQYAEEGRIVRLSATCMVERTQALPCSMDAVNSYQYRISGMFDLASRPYAVRVEFDPQYGYPSLIVLDDPEALDDEQIITVTHFEVLPGTANLDVLATATAESRLSATPGATSTPAPQGIPTATVTPYTPAPTPYRNTISFQPVVPEDDLTTALKNGQQQWDALGVDDYAISLSEMNPWNGMILTLQVRAGNIVRIETDCQPGWMSAPCEVWAIDADSFIVPGLFLLAQDAIEVDYGWSEVLTLDAVSGIPLRIFFDEEDVYDEEWSVDVTSLTLLEAPANTP